jgi:RNA-directed DNA polymerase
MPGSAKRSSQRVVKKRAKGVGPQASTLLSRVSTLASLRRAHGKVGRNRKSKGGVDDLSVAEFAINAEHSLRGIQHDLRAGAYKFSRLRPVAIEKKDGKTFRPILIPTVADRIVQRAILQELEGHLAPHVTNPNSHAFRSDANVRSAVYQLRDELKAGKRFVLIVDIVDFFSSVDSDRLFAELREVLPDQSLDGILGQLKNWEIDELKNISSYKRDCFPQAGKGVPQGSALSPILSNFFLRNLDRDGASNSFRTIRYADDVAIGCQSYDEAVAAYEWLKKRTDALGLQIHALGGKKSQVHSLVGKQQGVEYLGFYLRTTGSGINIRPSQRSIDNAIQTIKGFFDSKSKASLSERYTQLSYFLNAWFGTFGYVCGSIKREKEKLLRVAEDSLDGLLKQRGFVSAHSGLTKEQRRFLGVDSIFAKATKKPNKATKRPVRI